MTSINNLETMPGRWCRIVFAAVVAVIGLSLAVGGGMLVAAGGSSYYALTGLLLLASGVLLLLRDRRGAWLYGAVLVLTAGWSVWEVGFTPWELVPRLVAPAVLGLGLQFSWTRGLDRHAPVLRSVGGWPVFAAGMVAAVAAGALAGVAGPGHPVDPLWQTGGSVAPPGRLPRPLAPLSSADWQAFGGDQGGTRFSPADQINPGNVGRLEKVWEAETGPVLPGPTGGLEVTPVMIGDAFYVCNGYNEVIAFDAETGKERWRFDMAGGVERQGKPCRGVTYARIPGATGARAERIFAASQIPDLVALDAGTGRPCAGFGENGRAALWDGMNKASFGLYYVSSAPQLIRGKLVVGGGILDNQLWGAPSGVIRAFDATTGKLAWAYDVGRPGQTGVPPQGETYTPSTPNSWAPISADERLGLVYMPMGNSSPDLYGAQRRPIDDEISSSILALDAETGQVRWRFQTVHHDLWDFDVPSQPTLVDVLMPSGPRPALIQPTKRGEVFVLDRETGEPIRTVNEVAVPHEGLAPGDRLSPTQPFSVGMPSFRGPLLREADMWGVTPIDQMICRIRFRQARYEGTMTPVGVDHETIIQPGYGGGSNWGSVAVDVDRGILVVTSMRLPVMGKLITRAAADTRGMKITEGRGPTPGDDTPMANTPYAAVLGPFLSPLGTPCTPPPWGTITGVDLATSRVVWHRPLGTARDTGPLGIPSMLPLTIGVPFSGGAITTRGGLIFMAGTVEQAIRAFDVMTGEEMWKARLPAGGQATPMTYVSPRSGRQFVLIAAGGKPTLKTTRGTTIVAYALPR